VEVNGAIVTGDISINVASIALSGAQLLMENGLSIQVSTSLNLTDNGYIYTTSNITAPSVVLTTNGTIEGEYVVEQQVWANSFLCDNSSVKGIEIISGRPAGPSALSNCNLAYWTNRNNAGGATTTIDGEANFLGRVHFYGDVLVTAGTSINDLFSGISFDSTGGTITMEANSLISAVDFNLADGTLLIPDLAGKTATLSSESGVVTWDETFVFAITPTLANTPLHLVGAPADLSIYVGLNFTNGATPEPGKLYSLFQFPPNSTISVISAVTANMPYVINYEVIGQTFQVKMAGPIITNTTEPPSKDELPLPLWAIILLAAVAGGIVSGVAFAIIAFFNRPKNDYERIE